MILALAAGLYVGWNIGSNDAANAMGVPVGGRMISYRRSISIMVLFVVLGAVLEGWKVMKTVGGEIVTSPGGNPLAAIPEIAVVVLIAAGAWVTIATTLKLPVSTSQSIVGAVMGAGLLLAFTQPSAAANASVQFGKLGSIGLCWILTPIAAALFAYVVYHLAGPPLRRIGSATTLARILGVLVVATGAFAAYSLGANGVGNATAMVYTITRREVIWSPQLIGLFGGIALAVGALTYSRRVMETVGTGITRLDAMTAFSAQFGAALTVWIFTQFGIPVSTSQAIVGGVAGAGIVKGTAAVSGGKLRNIGVAWVLTPSVAAGFSFGLGMLVLGV